VPATDCKGKILSTPFSLIASLGMPKTMQVASSWAIVLAPACFISSIPRAPSSPIPVRITPPHLSRIAGSGPKQHIDRGPMAADQRPVLDFNVIAGAASLEQQVMVARRNQRASANDGVVGLGFFHTNTAQAVEPVGKGAREQLRHVLHNHNAGRIAGSASSTVFNASVPPVEAPMTTTFLRRLGHGVGGRESIASAVSLGSTVWLGVRVRNLAPAADFTASQRAMRESSRNCFVPSRGLVTISTAPYSRALNVLCAPSSAKLEQMTTGSDAGS